VLLPKDYLRLRLTGEPLSDMSDAAGTLWLDVARRGWSEPMLAATGLTRAQMPGLVEGSAPAGRLLPEIARQLGLGPVVVAGGGGDNAASAVGCGVVAPGQALLSLGTSGVLFVVTDRFRPNPERAAHAFCHALPGLWHQMSVMLSAASTLDWVTRLTGLADVPTAATAAEQRGLHVATPLFLPYLSGERTPHNDADARGVFFRLQAETAPADLIVSVLEGVAHGLRDGLDALTAAGSRVDDIDVVGGGSRLSYWLHLIASGLERRLVLRTGGDVGAALGAARLARLAAGADPASVCTAPPVQSVFEPDSALAGLLRERRPAFAAVYRQLENTFKEFPA
jgi:xylulokinase